MNEALRIAIISGGHSAEADVSRSSAQGVLNALKQNYSEVINLDLDSDLASSLKAFAPQVVFPVLHGPPGEDGTLQGFLEILGLPYVGSDVHGSAFAMDKIVSKSIFREAGLPLIPQTVVQLADGTASAVKRITTDLGDYVVVKPARQGSAVGVTLVDNENQLHQALTDAFQFDHRLLVEKRIDGREITVGVIDTDTGSEAFQVIEIITPPETWYDYEHRYTAGLSEHVMPAKLDADFTAKLQNLAIKAHQALGCRDLSRADFLVSEGNCFLLEVNTLPGMTPTSLYPDGAAGYGLDFAALVSYLVERAAARGN